MYVCVCVYECMCVCIYMCVCICVCECVYIYVCVCMFVYVCMYMCVCMYMYVFLKYIFIHRYTLADAVHVVIYFRTNSTSITLISPSNKLAESPFTCKRLVYPRYRWAPCTGGCLCLLSEKNHLTCLNLHQSLHVK